MPAACIPGGEWGRDGRPVIPPGLSDAERQEAYRDARRRGYFLGRALVSAASQARVEGTNTGRLGRALCGYGTPFRPLREEAPRALSIRVQNVNGALDDEWQFQVLGTEAGATFAQSFYWDGAPDNNTLYGPWDAAPGLYALSAYVAVPNANGNFFMIHIYLDGGLLVSLTSDEVMAGEGIAYSFTVDPLPVAP